MPDLDLDQLSSWPHAAPYVFSVMVFPRDPKRQHAYFQSLLAAHAAEDLATSNDGSVCRGLANALYQTPQPQHLVNDRQWQAIDRSLNFVSWALGFVLRMASDLPELASINNAIKHVAMSGDGKVDTLDRSWKTYKSVAHLWMAQFDIGVQPFGPKLEDHPEVFLQFLATAEALRKMGEAWKHLNAHTPVLDPKVTWKVPAGFELPAVHLEFEPLTPDQQKIWRSQLG